MDINDKWSKIKNVFGKKWRVEVYSSKSRSKLTPKNWATRAIRMVGIPTCINIQSRYNNPTCVFSLSLFFFCLSPLFYIKITHRRFIVTKNNTIRRGYYFRFSYRYYKIRTHIALFFIVLSCSSIFLCIDGSPLVLYVKTKKFKFFFFFANISTDIFLEYKAIRCILSILTTFFQRSFENVAFIFSS